MAAASTTTTVNKESEITPIVMDAPDVTSDLIFIVQNKEFHVTRDIMAKTSDVFNSLLTAGFKESFEKKIELTHVSSADCFHILLKHAYKQEIDMENIKSSYYSEVLELCDYYDMPSLYNELCEFLNEKIIVTNETMVHLINVAYNHNCSQLYNKAKMYICRNVNGIVSGKEWNLIDIDEKVLRDLLCAEYFLCDQGMDRLILILNCIEHKNWSSQEQRVSWLSFVNFNAISFLSFLRAIENNPLFSRYEKEIKIGGKNSKNTGINVNLSYSEFNTTYFNTETFYMDDFKCKISVTKDNKVTESKLNVAFVKWNKNVCIFRTYLIQCLTTYYHPSTRKIENMFHENQIDLNYAMSTCIVISVDTKDIIQINVSIKRK